MKLRNLLFAGVLLALLLAVALPAVANAAPDASNGVHAVKYKVYIVKEGDTLGKIARKFGVSISSILKANKLGAGSRIYVGQQLRIPVNEKQQKKQAPKKNVNKKPSAKSPNRPANFQVPNAWKWIEVDLSQQRLYAYENGRMVFTTLISSGRSPYRTPIGSFRVWAKVRRQTMSGPGYRLPNVQWVMYFAGENAIHGTYWHNNFGRPMSHGCVNATNKAAQWLYNWAPKGTLVVVHR
jgi:lipoprotein-anchoring transpeptidase ErfK/SrfK